MDKQRQDVQVEPTYSSSVPIQDIALRIYRKQWTIRRCGKRGLGISVLIARHDDDDDDVMNKYGKNIEGYISNELINSKINVINLINETLMRRIIVLIMELIFINYVNFIH